jgi:hypothetical protein
VSLCETHTHAGSCGNIPGNHLGLTRTFVSCVWLRLVGDVSVVRRRKMRYVRVWRWAWPLGLQLWWLSSAQGSSRS